MPGYIIAKEKEVVTVKTFMPYPHQEAGISWILERPACALLWGMG